MLRIAGAGDYRHAYLQIPAQDHLRRGFPMPGSDFAKNRIAQHGSGIPASAQGIPSLDSNILRQTLNMSDNRTVLVEGMDFILN